jgi:hypothetical protein
VVDVLSFLGEGGFYGEGMDVEVGLHQGGKAP